MVNVSCCRSSQIFNGFGKRVFAPPRRGEEKRMERGDGDTVWSTDRAVSATTIGERVAAAAAIAVKQAAAKIANGNEEETKSAKQPAAVDPSATSPSTLRQKLAQLKLKRRAPVPPAKGGKVAVTTTTEEIVKADVAELQATIRLLVEEHETAYGMSAIARAANGISIEEVSALLKEAMALPSSGSNPQVRQLLSAAAAAAYIEAMAARTGPSREEIDALTNQLVREKFLRVSTREESDISMIGRPVRLTSRDEGDFVGAALQALRVLLKRNSQANAQKDRALVTRFAEVAKLDFSGITSGKPGYIVIPVEISPGKEKSYIVRGSVLVCSTGGERPILSIAEPKRAGVDAPWTSRLERFFAPAAEANVHLLASTLVDEKPSVRGERLSPEIWRSVWNLFNALKRYRAIYENRRELIGKATGFLEDFWGNVIPCTLFFDFGPWRFERETGNRKVVEWIPDFFGIIERNNAGEFRVKFADHLVAVTGDSKEWLAAADFSKLPGIAGQVVRRSRGVFHRLQEERANSAAELAKLEKVYPPAPAPDADAERITIYPEALKPSPGLELEPEDILPSPPMTEKTVPAAVETADDADEAADEAADDEAAAPRGGKRSRKPATKAHRRKQEDE